MLANLLFGPTEIDIVLGKSAPPLLNMANDALFADIDGTLASIADDPADVQLDEAGRELLKALGARAGGAVALLTGRTLEDADRITGSAVAAIGALHGLQMRSARGVGISTAPSESVRAAADVFATHIGDGRLAARLEDKGASVALHYRHAPEAGASIDAFATEVARAHELRVQKGKMVIEILPPGRNKGDALRTFMRGAPFAGRTPVMVGDDLTDESAFAAANALGGFSVLVGPPRQTAAGYVLDDEDAVRAWLTRALGAAQ